MTFKIDLVPGTKLSERYNNRRDCYKIVETDIVIGYVVSSGGRESAAAIYPLYRADVHVRVGKTRHSLSSYEMGDRLNAHTFDEDYEGCTFATIAAQAIRALDERHRAQQLVKQAEAKKPRRKRTR